MHTELTLAASQPPCPGCGGAMMQLATETGVIAGCSGCGGTWVDHVVGRHVLPRVRAAVSEPSPTLGVA